MSRALGGATPETGRSTPSHREDDRSRDRRSSHHLMQMAWRVSLSLLRRPRLRVDRRTVSTPPQRCGDASGGGGGRNPPECTSCHTASTRSAGEGDIQQVQCICCECASPVIAVQVEALPPHPVAPCVACARRSSTPSPRRMHRLRLSATRSPRHYRCSPSVKLRLLPTARDVIVDVAVLCGGRGATHSESDAHDQTRGDRASATSEATTVRRCRE